MKVGPIDTVPYQLQTMPVVTVHLPEKAAETGKSIVDSVTDGKGLVEALRQHDDTLNPSNLRLYADVVQLAIASKDEAPWLQDRIMLCLGVQEFFERSGEGINPISDGPDYESSPHASGANLARIYEILGGRL